MEAKTIAGVAIIAIGVACFRLEKSNRRFEAGSLLIAVGAILVLDDFFHPGWIPGNWGLTGAGAIGWGLRTLYDLRSVSKQRA